MPTAWRHYVSLPGSCEQQCKRETAFGAQPESIFEASGGFRSAGVHIIVLQGTDVEKSTTEQLRKRHRHVAEEARAKNAELDRLRSLLKECLDCKLKIES